MMLSGWGRYPRLDTRLEAPRGEEALRALLADPLIARGNGRAYGDAAIGVPLTAQMRNFNRMIAFDAESGQLVAEAGVQLAEIISAFLPRGFFPLVTPGTKFVTLGGAIAADVHGKNHHKDGSFAACLDWIEIMGPDGAVTRCSRDQNADLFTWTVGGMGLTGIILRAALRLRRVESAWIRQTLLPAANIDEAMDLFERNDAATYSVAWIDCLSRGAGLGRSLVMLGEHASRAELDLKRAASPFDIGRRPSLAVPFDAPSGLLNSLTVRAFNEAYYWKGRGAAGESFVNWDSYFYPLDAVLEWNRIYGRNGFAQFQCVLPLESSARGMRALLEMISDAGAGSFLAVLKRFGPQESRFSFPMLGYTLALDFPVNQRMLTLMERLDRIVLEHGGRFYLAKDSRMSAATLAASDPRAQGFRDLRQSHSLAGRFRSAQSERLAL
ncbi:FAD/FMN-containing dehydrogenase [Ensifer adhaerens]|nr:FAD/FMN-containing dehydrogenase [Ensifer adhaerens]